jgi:hypothetical protein
MAEALRDEVEEREYVWMGATGHVGADVDVRDIREVLRDCVFEMRKTRLNAPPDQIQEIILGTDMTGTDSPKFAKAIIPLCDLLKDESNDHRCKSELFTITANRLFGNLLDKESAKFE